MSRILETVLARRGYLLNYHRLMAAHDPALLEAYDAFYTALTLTQNRLAPDTREIVWIALLVAMRQAQGRLHVERARALGMDQEVIAQAAVLAALPASMLDAAPMVPRAAALLAIATCRAALRDWEGMRAAIGMGVSGAEVMEALTLTMIPCGLATFFDAMAAWRGADDAGWLGLTADAPHLGGVLRVYLEALVVRPRALGVQERGAVLAVLGNSVGLVLGRTAWAGRQPPSPNPLPTEAGSPFQAWGALGFVEDRWAGELPGFGAEGRYLEVLERMGPARVVHLKGLLAHAIRGDQAAVRLHVLGAFDAGVTAPEVAEVITYIRLGGTGAAFIAATDTWQQAARAGLCVAPYAEAST